MMTLSVELGPRTYPIHIGLNLLNDRALVRTLIPARQVMVVTNTVVAPLYLRALTDCLVGSTVHTFVLPDGEAHKTLASYEKILSAMLEAKFDRSCMVVALGGGVVGDVAGFAAASYQRGVGLVQVPTTLLAQVDSSVGGKTAVNHPLGKNMIGAFYQPQAVLIDLNTLETLPAREFSAGLAEVVKVGLISDYEFFCWLEANRDRLLAREPAVITYAVERSCRRKAAVVTLDERETGARALLNLGHTFGHGLENVLGYGVWLHGEAVAAGICMAARMSQRLGYIDAGAVHRIVALCAHFGLPTTRPARVSPAQLLAAMQIDKKASDGRIRLVLLQALGRAALSADYAEAALHATLSDP